MIVADAAIGQETAKPVEPEKPKIEVGRSLDKPLHLQGLRRRQRRAGIDRAASRSFDALTRHCKHRHSAACNSGQVRTNDLAADPIAIDAHLSKNRKLRPPIARHRGTRVPYLAAVLRVRGDRVVGDILNVWSAAGMPRSRDAIRSIARAVAGDPTLLARGRTLDETIDRLTALRGIGPWTAHYIAMRALGHTDAFPDSDLGLRKAAVTLGIGKLRDRADRWRPFRAYAAILLWETL